LDLSVKMVGLVEARVRLSPCARCSAAALRGGHDRGTTPEGQERHRQGAQGM
jgi:hypothetical protein